MPEKSIQLLQFMICKDFEVLEKDSYRAEGVHGNLYVSQFPYGMTQHCVVTCWRKDTRFHKEVLEYETDYGAKIRTAHMDIEPITDSVLFRWHKHPLPKDLVIEKPCLLTVRIILDWKVHFESYIMIEGSPA
jgi:hypothetical protein